MPPTIAGTCFCDLVRNHCIIVVLMTNQNVQKIIGASAKFFTSSDQI